METTDKCLKEWNATIEALGHGKQTILIRRYGTKLDGFLLYPSTSYAFKDNYLDAFQSKYRDFAENNAFPDKEGDKVSIKYYAIVEKVIEKSFHNIGSLQKNYIWTSEHVRQYLKRKKAYVWFLRVYGIKNPYLDRPKPGMIKYVKLKEKISLKDMKPVLSDSEFNKIINYIK